AEQARLFRQLQSKEGSTPAEEEDKAPASLTTTEIADLNRTCAWFARQEKLTSTAPFGDTIEDAIAENVPKTFGTITIGAQEWTKGPVQFLMPLKPVLDDLLAFEQTASNAAEPLVYRSPMVRLDAFKTALDKARTVAEKSKGVQATLLTRL